MTSALATDLALLGIAFTFVVVMAVFVVNMTTQPRDHVEPPTYRLIDPAVFTRAVGRVSMADIPRPVRQVGSATRRLPAWQVLVYGYLLPYRPTHTGGAR